MVNFFVEWRNEVLFWDDRVIGIFIRREREREMRYFFLFCGNLFSDRLLLLIGCFI